jgi:hypothetical protein
MAVTVLTSGVQYIQRMLVAAAKLSSAIAGALPTDKLIAVASKLPGFVPGKEPLAFIRAAIFNCKVNAVLSVIMMALAIIICTDCAIKWVGILKSPSKPDDIEPDRDLMGLAEGTEISD